jgi:hypothetical protein
VQKTERDNSQSHRHGIPVSGKSVNECKREEIQDQSGNRCDDIRFEKQMNQKKSEHKNGQPNNEKRCLVSQYVKAEQLEESPNIIVKQSFSRNREMKPSRLIWVTDNVTLEVPKVPSGLVKQSVSPFQGAVPKFQRCEAMKKTIQNRKKAVFGFSNSFKSVARSRGLGRRLTAKRTC